ncbi:MAG: transporter [Capsulimonadaceae bacterium]|nr:transporter [Capsulimonadaceae bacterium]
MKRILLATLTVAVLALSAGNVFADELWNPHLRGSDEGLAAGVVPPKGVYFVNDSYFSSMSYCDAKGHSTGTKLDLMVDVPIVLWNPGFKVRGADYAVAVAQPFDYTSVYSNTAPGVGNGHVGTYNTVIVPGMLSWALPNDLHLKASLSTLANDPSTSPAHPADYKGAGSGNSYWTIEPGVALSWLHNGWNVSGDFKYDYNLKDSSTNYQSGDQFSGDYTITQTKNKFTKGIGAYSTNQLKEDRIKGVDTPGTIRVTYGAGPILGYEFGGISVQAQYNWNLKTENDFGGNTLNIRFVGVL